MIICSCRSALTSGGVTPHTGPSLVGTHSVHNVAGSGSGAGGGGGGSSGSGSGGVGANSGNTGGGTASVSQVASSVSVGSSTPTGTNSGSSSNATSSSAGGAQHSTNTAPQHPSREPQPPPPHHHPHHHHQPPAQPVEFNHAINYVNKIKVGAPVVSWFPLFSFFMELFVDLQILAKT